MLSLITVVLRALFAKSATAALLVCALVDAHAQPDRPSTISGRATVIDAETLEIRGQRIRLAGIETVADDHVCEATDDNRWRCGPRAQTALDELLEESIVTCVARERDSLGRLVATCSVGPVDLSLWLVRNGLALAALASNGRLRQAHDEARAARRGIWSNRGGP